MTREQMINQMIEKANKVIKDWTRAGEDEIWTMCSDWNREHEDEEIFMSETTGFSGTKVVGFMIEDDTYYYQEEV